MAATVIAMYILSATLIALGFIALLAQKVYLDAETSEPISINIPALGKLKTNYPALIFVLGGVFLAWYTFEKSTAQTKEWYISGRVEVDKSAVTDENREQLEAIDWTEMEILPVPFITSDRSIASNGTFDFTIEIPIGTDFDTEILSLKIDHPILVGGISPISATLENGVLAAPKTASTREYLLSVEPVFPPSEEG